MADVGFTLRAAAMAALLAIGVGAAATATAQDGAEAVKSRQALMKEIGANMKGVGDVVKGASGETLDDLKRRAGEISAAAGKIPAAFDAEVHTDNAPAGVETTAMPAIWTDRAKFEEAAKALEAAAATLAGAADMDGARAAFPDVGRSCGACHNAFRQKKS
ncbi:MAG: c-type cytochrome [Alphaproteobacteria bacterium]